MNAFNNVEASTEEIWNQLKTALLDTTNETCGKTKKRHHKRETWWWNGEVNSAIAVKRWCWKAWKQGGGKEQYLQAKQNAKRTVYTAKKTAEEKKFSDQKPGMDDIFKIAKQLRKDNQDVVGDKCVKDDSGNLSFDNVNDLLKRQRNDRAMIQWTCNVRLEDRISSDALLRKLGINNIQTLL